MDLIRQGSVYGVRCSFGFVELDAKLLEAGYVFHNAEQVAAILHGVHGGGINPVRRVFGVVEGGDMRIDSRAWVHQEEPDLSSDFSVRGHVMI